MTKNWEVWVGVDDAITSSQTIYFSELTGAARIILTLLAEEAAAKGLSELEREYPWREDIMEEKMDVSKVLVANIDCKTKTLKLVLMTSALADQLREMQH
jgi:hypothetical protein